MNTKVLTVNKEVLDKNINRCRERGIILPTISQMQDPKKIPEKLVEEIKKVGLNDVNPLNLFRVNWHNDPATGGFKAVPTYVEIPEAISGVKARIVLMIGKFFPTGAHKVGATYCALVDSLTSGQFDPEHHVAIWPSTGNYCRGGAFNSSLLGCPCIAILPEQMSQERFDWLREIGAEVYATPGCESNVKEIFDKANELVATRGEVINFNQFELEGNCAWHYNVTGPALSEVFDDMKHDGDRLFGTFFTTGSAGTISAADYIKDNYCRAVTGCGEALQCPTMYNNGYGDHRIEGIGDKHIPWIFNSKSQDICVCLDDEDCMRTFRLFNTPEGHEALRRNGVPDETIEKLSLLGISGVANMIGCIKMAKYYECDSNDVLMTVATDSAAMYQSRLKELDEKRGKYTQIEAERDHARLINIRTDYMKELTLDGKKAIHHLKYYTWIEQQGKSLAELNAQWNDKKYWHERYAMALRLEDRITSFNEQTGLLKKYE